MADFGFWELALILFVALLVVGPERLPALASTLGRWLGRVRGIANQFKTDFMNETRAGDLKKIMGDTHDALGDAQRRINRNLRNTDPLAQSIEEQIASGRFKSDETPEATSDATSDAAHADGGQAAPHDAIPDTKDVRPDDRPLGRD